MKKGIDAKITVEISGMDVEVTGCADWSYSGEVRDVYEELCFGDEFKDKDVGAYEGGTLEVKGFFRLDTDAGQQFLADAFAAKTHLITSKIKFFVDATKYITPDNATSPASFVVLTKNCETGQAVAGTAPLSFTAICVGRMKNA